MHKAKPKPIAVKRSRRVSLNSLMLTPINVYVPIERAFMIATKEKKSIGVNPRFRIFKPLRDNPNML